jgi:hypothetical protein
VRSVPAFVGVLAGVRCFDLQMHFSIASIGPAELAWPAECARRAAGRPVRPARRLLVLGWLAEELCAIVATRWRFAPAVGRSNAQPA